MRAPVALKVAFATAGAVVFHTISCTATGTLPSITIFGNGRGKPAVPNYKNLNPLVITLRLSHYPSRTLGELIKKWRLERGLFQVDLVKRIEGSEMTIVNWEEGDQTN